MTEARIDLEDYRTPGAKVFIGRDRGRDVRIRSNIDSLSRTCDKITIIIPNDIYSISQSFLEELFANVVKETGGKLFYKQFTIVNEGEYKITGLLDAAIKKILRSHPTAGLYLGTPDPILFDNAHQWWKDHDIELVERTRPFVKLTYPKDLITKEAATMEKRTKKRVRELVYAGAFFTCAICLLVFLLWLVGTVPNTLAWYAVLRTIIPIIILAIAVLLVTGIVIIIE